MGAREERLQWMAAGAQASGGRKAEGLSCQYNKLLDAPVL